MDHIGKYVIVRTYSAGVHAGVLLRKEGKEVELTDSRRIWYWAGAASLSGLASAGTSKPRDCQFGDPVRIILTEAIEIILCTAESEQSIREVPPWKV